MKINRVTLTGADGSISPDQLIPITNAFPFVEWGILFSPKYRGEPRFPTDEWVQKFLALALPSSAHLCGSAVDQFVDGVPPDYRGFGRIQLNFSLKVKDYLLPKLPGIISREKQTERPIIFQMNSANRVLATESFVESMLFDASGGRGVSPTTWPECDTSRYCGYSGGLGPDTLADQLEYIAQVAGDSTVWIDMEGRIRSDEDRQFDLDKVSRCLEIASRWVA